MVKVSILAGPFRGEIRQFEGNRNLERNVQVDPAALLSDFVQHGSRWKIDFSAATPEELLAWGQADFVARIVRALREKRPVHFMGRVYTRLKEAGALDDAIAESGRMVCIGRDDEQMLVITAIGYEET